jgi:hypothetical protein
MDKKSWEAYVGITVGKSGELEWGLMTLRITDLKFKIRVKSNKELAFCSWKARAQLQDINNILTTGFHYRILQISILWSSISRKKKSSSR